ncbi:MAG: hypothetical protein Q8916_01555 [Bacteroidota bacterium]|nr:hypothetical protein [Bacteroidota bacterium]MDP4237233.1 hypothetical protein [Bacteroidota bacterium]
MALFKEKLTTEILNLVTKRYEKFESALGKKPSTEDSEASEKLTIADDMKLLIAVANGEITRSAVMMARVEGALKRILDLLLSNSMQPAPAFYDGFWDTDIGVVASRARWWISVDELITISNAAALAFGENSQPNRMRIARAMDKGLLDWVPDPSVTNPMHNRRVLRDQVERLRDIRSLPE